MELLQSNLDDLRLKIKQIENTNDFIDDSPSDDLSSQLNTQTKQCFKKIIVLLNYKERCSWELKERLRKLNYSDKCIKFAIKKAKKLKLVDDFRYAEMYIYSKLNNSRGIPGILQYLKSMRIDINDSDTLTKLIKDASMSENERAYSFLKNHPPRSKDIYSGAIRKLVNRGYSVNTAVKATNKWLTYLGKR